MVAAAKGEWELRIDSDFYIVHQVLSVPEDVIDGFTYNLILVMENSDGAECTTCVYAYEMGYGAGIHVQFMRWDGTVEQLEPVDDYPIS